MVRVVVGRNHRPSPVGSPRGCDRAIPSTQSPEEGDVDSAGTEGQRLANEEASETLSRPQCDGSEDSGTDSGGLNTAHRDS